MPVLLHCPDVAVVSWFSMHAHAALGRLRGMESGSAPGSRSMSPASSGASDMAASSEGVGRPHAHRCTFSSALRSCTPETRCPQGRAAIWCHRNHRDQTQRSSPFAAHMPPLHMWCFCGELAYCTHSLQCYAKSAVAGDYHGTTGCEYLFGQMAGVHSICCWCDSIFSAVHPL
jgi:hypothetical protein